MPLDGKYNEGPDGTSVGEGLECEEVVLFGPDSVQVKKGAMLHRSLARGQIVVFDFAGCRELEDGVVVVVGIVAFVGMVVGGNMVVEGIVVGCIVVGIMGGSMVQVLEVWVIDSLGSGVRSFVG